MDALFDTIEGSPSTEYPDDDIERVHSALAAQDDPIEVFGACIRTALDEVIDTARTGRWDLEACGDQEKAYVGVKVENVVRGAFDLPPVRRGMPDYEIAGIPVDCKWTKTMWRWSIPTEAVGHICLLIHADDARSTFCVGLVRITDNILNPRPNKDGKRTIRAEARSAIHWICGPDAALPQNFLLQMPAADRSAILWHRGGDARMLELFRRHPGIIIKRHTVVSLAQQVDATRRVRAVRRQLRAEGMELLNGHWAEQKQRSIELGGPILADSTEWVCMPSRRESTPD